MLLMLTPATTMAFKPGLIPRLQANTHPEITAAALNAIESPDLPFDPGSRRIRFSENAINDVCTANKLTDSPTDPPAYAADASGARAFNNHEAHVDGDMIEKGGLRLTRLKQEIINVLLENPPDGVRARESLGTALHTLQDFYAHSNWAEVHRSEATSALVGASELEDYARGVREFNDNGGAHPGRIWTILGREEPSSRPVVFIDPPCRTEDPHGPSRWDSAHDTLSVSFNTDSRGRDDQKGLRTTLTTGFWIGGVAGGCPNNDAPAEGWSPGKCLHGATLGVVSRCWGIAKDETDSEFHVQARNTATRATIDFVYQIVYDDQLKRASDSSDYKDRLCALFGDANCQVDCPVDALQAAPTDIHMMKLRGGPGAYWATRKTAGDAQHSGVDLVQATGSTEWRSYAVLAAHEGTIAFARYDGTPPMEAMSYTVPHKGGQRTQASRDEQKPDGYGYTVVIDHGGGHYSLYGHLAYDASRALAGELKVDSPVRLGQLLGVAYYPGSPPEASSGNVDAEILGSGVIPVIDPRSGEGKCLLHLELFDAPPGRRARDQKHGMLEEIVAGAEYVNPTCALERLGYRN